MGAAGLLMTLGKTATDEWVDLLFAIRNFGQSSKPRGLRIKELLCKTTQIDMRFPVVAAKIRKIGYKFAAAEAFNILTGRSDVASIAQYSPHISSFSNDGQHFDGHYGPMVVQQLRYVVDSLVKDPDSRQGAMSIWRPNPRDSRDVSCTLMLQWLIRDRQLICVDTMRSSDAWLGWPYDIFSFSMLSAYILLLLRARGLGAFERLELGSLFLTAGSSHLYVDPRADGSLNIPYGLADVESVLSDCFKANEVVKHAPLNVDEFDSPQDFLHHLELLKDRRPTRHAWMREFLSPKEETRRVTFEFDDRSLVEVEKLRAQGFKFIEVDVGDRKLLAPEVEK